MISGAFERLGSLLTRHEQTPLVLDFSPTTNLGHSKMREKETFSSLKGEGRGENE
jgi:hypothetical protein